MRSYYVIKLLNPRDNATIGYYQRGRYIPVLHNYLATKFDDASDARGIAAGMMPDHDFGNFMSGWKVKPNLQVIHVTRKG